MDGLRAFFRLVFDRTAGKRFEQETQASIAKGTDPSRAKQNARETSRAYENVQKAILAAFSFEAVRRFFAASFAAVDTLEAATRKLAGTAKITGVNLDFLQETAGKLETNFRLATPIANDLTATMAKLTQRAGDVTVTGAALTRFLDLAAVNGYGAAEALDALNLTLTGQDEGLNRLGLANPQQIYEKWGAGTDEASKAQAILNELMVSGEKALGAYEERMRGARGEQERANQALLEAQVALGEASGPARIEGLRVLTLSFEYLQTAIQTTADVASGTIASWRQYWDAVRGFVGLSNNFEQSQAPGGSRNPFRARPNVAGPPRATSAPPFNPAATASAAGTTVGKSAGPTFEDRVKEMEKAANEWLHSQAHADLMTSLGAFREPFAGAPDVTPVGLSGEGRDLRPVEEANAFESALQDAFDNVESASAKAAYAMASAFQDAFDLMREEGLSVGNFLEGVGRGMAGALLAGLAEYAQGKSQEAIAHAIEAGAKALLYHDPSAAASIPGFLAEAAAWGVLAGGAGSARGAVTGGRGAIPASTRDVGIGSARGAAGAGAEVHIYIDPLDPSRPAYQRNVYTAQQYAMERYGASARVTVHPGSGGSR